MSGMKKFVVVEIANEFVPSDSTALIPPHVWEKLVEGGIDPSKKLETAYYIDLMIWRYIQLDGVYPMKKDTRKCR